MNKRFGTTLALAAASGLLAGLAGCGGGAQATDPATTPTAQPAATMAPMDKDKNGCKGEAGEKHSCGAAKGDEKHEEKPADAPK